jgi:TonB family protein
VAASALPPAPARPTDGVDAAQLTGKGDALPTLLVGKPPASPATALPLSPTIVCRLLIAPDGTVARAQIFRSRLELTPYEDAALQAVQHYRFTPATRAGQPVAAWINWPVRFAN